LEEASGSVRLTLVLRGTRIALPRFGTVVLGRGVDCEVLLDGDHVSRRHAQLELNGTWCIEDLGSTNGVWVDGIRINDRAILSGGETITIGTHELVVTADADAEEDHEDRTTLVEVPSPASGAPKQSDGERATLAPSPTRRTSFLDVFGPVVDKLVAKGAAAEAEKIVGSHLRSLLAAPERADDALLRGAAALAVRLAGATRNSEWLEYTFVLHSAAGLVMRRELVDDIYRVAHLIGGFNPRSISGYVAWLNERRHELGPRERFVLQRLDGLGQMIS
jgi:pSer/pThr/pTyr-binding forkhead associated (FHA) protein